MIRPACLKGRLSSQFSGQLLLENQQQLKGYDHASEPSGSVKRGRPRLALFLSRPRTRQAKVAFRAIVLKNSLARSLAAISESERPAQQLFISLLGNSAN